MASLDEHGTFFFTSLRSYQTTLASIYSGTFRDGVVSGLRLVESISQHQAGWINMDVEISADGNTLYISDAFFDNGRSVPTKSDISLAVKRDGVFQRTADSAAILAQVNTEDLEYAPSISSDNLELFFTRARRGLVAGVVPSGHVTFQVLHAKRKHASDPFGMPQVIEAISGTVEGPTISGDGTVLYYHKRENGRFMIYRVRRERNEH